MGDQAVAQHGVGVKPPTPCFVKGSGSYATLHTVEQLYKDHDRRTAIVLGSGPSLIGFDFSQLNRNHFFVIGINDEVARNRDKFQLGAWMFYDAGIMKKHRNTPVSKDLIISTRKPMVHALVSTSRAPNFVPDWAHRIHTFETTRSWTFAHPQFLMHRTTAVPAVILSMRMGFKKILLLGVDCYTTPNAYYYDGQGPAQGRRKRATIKLADGDYSEDRHVQMMQDWTKLSEEIKKARPEWGGEIIQCSMRSPLTCFRKQPWGQAAMYGQ